MRRSLRSAVSRLAWFALVLPLVCTPILAGSAEPSDPSAARALIELTVDDVLKILNDDSLDTPSRLARLEQLAWERFDFTTMSRAVVAKYWRRFSDAQKDAFIAEFKTFLARSYGDRIERYTTETVEIIGERITSRGNVLVMTRIVGGEYGGAEVEYMLHHREDRWRVIDVKVEGISLVLNYRDQFRSILASGGPEKLLAALKRKNAENAAKVAS
jgi:phospholipid transport system substrate-binding protein